MKLKALIVDDEYSGRVSLKILLNADFSHLFESLTTAATLEEAIGLVRNNFFDICFLDIELHGQSGFELLPFLPSETKVFFVTAYSEYAIKAIKESAFDYILKPINPNELEISIKRFEEEFLSNTKKKKYLLVKDIKGTMLLPTEEIEYLRAFGPYSKIYSINKTVYTTTKTLKDSMEALGEGFIRIHRSYVVNKTMVKSFKRDSITTIHHTCLPVSRVNSKELLQHF